MTGTEMIMDQLKLITGRLDKMDERFDKMDERFDKMDERFDKMDERFDKMDDRLDNMEIALDTEINKVYLMTVKNSEDIQLLLPYKDKILNVSSTMDKIDRLEKNQQITDEVVASHSEKLRDFKLIKK